MAWLLTASLIWAFSFGLIKHELAGLPAPFVSWIRLTLSLLVFLPFLRLRGIGRRDLAACLSIGAVQYGFMYLAYIASFRHLAGHEVALFTVFTPLYVTAIHDLRTRRFHPRWLGSALLAIAGAAVIVHRSGAALSPAPVTGFLIVQVSNLCFAAGQLAYVERRRTAPGLPDHSAFALLYAGAVLVTTVPMLSATWGSSFAVSTRQWLALLYLGVIPSGLAFFLWNLGATRTQPGTLAVMNNAKIPLAVAVALIVFAEPADPLRLLAGGSAIAVAVWLNERHRTGSPPGGVET